MLWDLINRKWGFKLQKGNFITKWVVEATSIKRNREFYQKLEEII
jgi:hypothetical protein